MENTEKFFKCRLNKVLAFVVSISVVFHLLGSSSIIKYKAQASEKTGSGMAAWAMRAYNEGWQYSYGAASVGSVDCSGLIASYGVGGCRYDMMGSSPRTGSIGSLPDVPGLGLYMPGHVGVYVGSGMVVDARDYGINVCYQSVASMPWTNWFEIYGVSYYNSSSSATKNNIESSVDVSESTQRNSQNNLNIEIKQQDSTEQHSDITSNQEEVQAEVLANIPMQIGSTGLMVQALQTRLAELGYYNDEGTEYFGEYTAECLKVFQAKAGIQETGIADDGTMAILSSEDAPRNTPPVYELGMFDDAITSIQTRLIQLEYLSDGCETGYYGEETQNAVLDFQETSGLEVTGKADNTTVAVMNSETAQMNPKAIILKEGATGDDVVNLQERLRSLRYTVNEPTGIFDETTVQALNDYQASSQMEVTPSLSREQSDILYSDKAVKSPDSSNLRYGFRGNDVLRFQRKLQKLGYLIQEPTGIFDEATKEAVLKFENDNGIKESSIVTKVVKISVDANLKALNI